MIAGLRFVCMNSARLDAMSYLMCQALPVDRTRITDVRGYLSCGMEKAWTPAYEVTGVRI